MVKTGVHLLHYRWAELEEEAVGSCFPSSRDKDVLTSAVLGCTEQIPVLPQSKPAWDSGVRATLC